MPSINNELVMKKSILVSMEWAEANHFNKEGGKTKNKKQTNELENENVCD